MYEHYERHRTDNITDPALRRAHPISTISGWDREQDQSADDSKSPTEKAAIADGDTEAAVNIENVPEKVSKSEQTDATGDDVLGFDQVKCACEENADENGDKADATAPNTATTTSTDAAKPVQSISSISQVYNEQLTGQSATIVCNGDAEHDEDDADDGGDDTTTSCTPTKETLVEKQRTDNANSAASAAAATTDTATSGTDALRKTLEIDSFAEELNDDVDDNKEIVDEIVAEILTKSESLLDDCKRSLDETMTEETTTSSPVIKDEEIEHAVSEVVAGVRNIERMVKRDSETDTTLGDTAKDVSDRDNSNEIESKIAQHHHDHDQSTIIGNNVDEVVDDEIALEPCENQKTESEQNGPAGVADTQKSIGDTTFSATLIDVGSTPLAEKIIGTDANVGNDEHCDEIKDIVATIVNDVIANCVNQTTTLTTPATDNGNNNICDNDKMSMDNINNNRNNNNNTINNRNNSDVATNDSNDNAIIANVVNDDDDSGDETMKQTTTTTTTAPTIDVVSQRNEPTSETVATPAPPAPAEEITDEDIIKGIVAEIVDKCVVQSETNAAHDNDNNNNSDGDATALNHSGNEVFNANDADADDGVAEHSAKFTSASAAADNSDDNNRTSKLNRSQSTSISTSTQVENNHFGKLPRKCFTLLCASQSPFRYANLH